MRVNQERLFPRHYEVTSVYVFSFFFVMLSPVDTSDLSLRSSRIVIYSEGDNDGKV